jgi:Putative transposase.
VKISKFCLRKEGLNRNLGGLPGPGHIRNEERWHRYLHVQHRRARKVHFAKKTRGAWRSVKYLSRYLKRPPVAAFLRRHYRGGAVVHQYYDHRMQQHKRQKIGLEEMLQRYVSHIPSRHFKMVRYYGFFGQPQAGHAAAEDLRSAGDDRAGKTETPRVRGADERTRASAAI